MHKTRESIDEQQRQTMNSAEEQLIHDICVLDERIANEDNPEEVQKLVIRQKRAVNQFKKDCIKPYAEILKVAKCPDCDGSGTIVTSIYPNGEIKDIEQCRWCWEAEQLEREYLPEPK